MSKGDDDIRCQVMWQLDQDKKYDEVVNHLLTGCLNCITNPKKRFEGKEMLFPNAPPSWIKVPESEKSDPAAWKKYQKKRVHVQMTPEEFDQYLVDSDYSDQQIAFEIARFKKCERIPAWAGMKEIRKKQKEIRIEKEKVEKEQKKKEMEMKKEAEKLKKADEKRKIVEKKQMKDEERQEYLDKMKEEEKLLESETSKDSDEDDSEDVDVSGKQEPHSSASKPEFNLKNQMPWCPSHYDILCLDRHSKLNHESQKRVIAMCQNMMYHGALKHGGNKAELRDIRKECEEEYDILAGAALLHAKNDAIHPLDYRSKPSIKQCLHTFKLREPPGGDSNFYQYEKPVFTVEQIEETSGIRSINQAIQPKFEKLLKKAGISDVLIVPDMTKKCEIKGTKITPTNKFRLADDSVATSLIATCPQVSVMMDATTVSHLLSPNWESRDYEYGIPIIVKTERIDGDDKKIIVVSKPMPSNTINYASIQRKTLKRRLKAQFIRRTQPKTKPPKPTSEVSTSSEKADSESSDVSMISDSQESQKESQESSSSNNFLDDIITQMGKKPKKNQKTSRDSEESTYQYAVFRVGDARLLVRSTAPYKFEEPGFKKHEIFQKAKGITFEPRVEYLPNGGAMELGGPEWVWNYTKAVLKMSDSHVLYRASYRLDNMLQVDALTMRIDLQEPPPTALGLLSSRSLMLERMIAQLESLEDGEYMGLQSKNAPLTVAMKCDEDQRGSISIRVLRINESDVLEYTEENENDYFHGFCRDVALQWQIVQGRAPQLLLANDSPILNSMPSKMNREKLERRKNTIKRKFDFKRAEQEEAKKQREIDFDDPNLYADFTNPSVNPMEFKPNYDKRKRGGRGRGRGGGRPPKFGRGGGGDRGRGGARGGGARRGRGGGGGDQGPSDVVDIA